VDEDLRARARERRGAISSGDLRGAPLLDAILSVPPQDRDAWLDEVLGFDDSLAPDVTNLPRGSVPYLPCGVDEILAMVRGVPLGAEDVLVDLGSGMGRVTLLAHLLTGATAVGVEIQGPLVHAAEQRRTALAVQGVSFVRANAAEHAVDGTVFFLYAPFNGAMLAAVLRQLESVARRHAIVIATVDTELGEHAWLARRAEASARLALYDSRARGAPNARPATRAPRRSPS
jgi:SAM-dependent methyltransferase